MGAVINGFYYPDKNERTVESQTSVFKQSDHARQRKDNAREIIQPYKNGKPNSEFIEAFPDESKEVYHFLPTDEQLKGGK